MSLHCSHFRHICDGTWQCPDGDDETKCHKYNCTGLFHCVLGSKSVCLHPSEICNGINDCQSGEDEFLCELPAKCPISCQCLLYGIKCAHGTIKFSTLKCFDRICLLQVN